MDKSEIIISHLQELKSSLNILENSLIKESLVISFVVRAFSSVFLSYRFRLQGYFVKIIDVDLKMIKECDSEEKKQEVIKTTYKRIETVKNSLEKKKQLENMTFYHWPNIGMVNEKKRFDLFLESYKSLLSKIDEKQELNQMLNAKNVSEKIIQSSPDNILPDRKKEHKLTVSNFGDLIRKRRKEKIIEDSFEHDFNEKTVKHLSEVYAKLNVQKTPSLSEILSSPLDNINIVRHPSKKNPAYLVSFFLLFISEIFVEGGIQKNFVHIISEKKLISNVKGNSIDIDTFKREYINSLNGDKQNQVADLYNEIHFTFEQVGKKMRDRIQHAGNIYMVNGSNLFF